MAPKTTTSDSSDCGQLFMVGLPGPRPDPIARELIRDLGVGGVILFARNIEAPEQVWELIRDLQELAQAARGRPLLVAVDQEGGPVQRLKAPFTLIPGARELGLAATPAEVEALFQRVGRELASVGVNMNLAPVLDVARSPECPLWERSFGPDPERVAALGVAALRGLLAGGLCPVAKHFPGLGDTVRDSHVELPTATSPDPRRQADLIPFAAAVGAGVPAVMTAHVRIPAWDEQPGTLSAVAIQGWLRQTLGFSGVVMTDDLEMGAIREQTAVPQAARQALTAGADLLLICENPQLAWEAAALLKEEPALAPRIQEAARRLAGLRTRVRPAMKSRPDLQSFFARLHNI
jgi:beta-N-acetylhexosaminidase